MLHTNLSTVSTNPTEQRIRKTEFEHCSLAGEIIHSMGHIKLFQRNAHDNFHLLELAAYESHYGATSLCVTPTEQNSIPHAAQVPSYQILSSKIKNGLIALLTLRVFLSSVLKTDYEYSKRSKSN